MSIKLNQIGVLELTDEEFDILLEIFNHMPINTLLCSSYMAIKYRLSETLIPDSVIAEFIKILGSIPENHPWFSVIDKILKFRSEAVITI